MGFPERLFELRKNNNLSQKELAKNLGVAQASINYWEKGQRTPSIDVIILIADYFNVSIDYLLDIDIDTTLIRPNNSLTDALKNVTYIKTPNIKLEQLAVFFSKLNEQGQDKAVEQLEMLTKIPEYRKDIEY